MPQQDFRATCTDTSLSRHNTGSVRKSPKYEHNVSTLTTRHTKGRYATLRSTRKGHELESRQGYSPKILLLGLAHDI